jgi:hypothetical protein
MSDWVNQMHNVYLNATYMASDELKLIGTVVWNKSLGELDQVNMPDVEHQTEGILDHMDYDFTQMHTYSKVDFSLWRLTLGADYRVSDTWKAMLDVNYATLDDQAQYVYGSETGSYYMIRAGARMNF